MRIAVVAPKGSMQLGGAGTFEAEYFHALKITLQLTHTLVIFYSGEKVKPDNSWGQVEWVRINGVGMRRLIASVKRVTNRICNSLLWLPSPFRHEHWLDGYLRRHDVEFYIGLGQGVSPPTNTPYLFFVWDLLHRMHPYFPEGGQRGAWARRERLFSESTRRAAIIAVGTEVGKREVMDFYQVTTNRFCILPHPTPRFALEALPVDEVRIANLKARLGGDYVFYPANFHAHKNHITLLHAVALLRKAHGLKMNVALSGGDWGNLGHVKQTVKELGLEKQVHFLGLVSRSDLIELYRGATALTYTSLLGPENLPPLEAFALGCPVIASEIPGAAEQMGDAALLFSATDEQALGEAILRVKTDCEFRSALVARGKIRARLRNFEQLGQGTYRAIDEFAKTRRCWSTKGVYPVRFNFWRFFGG